MRAVIAILAAAVAAAVAGCSSHPTCLLEDVITDRVGAQELHDCGTAVPTTSVADVQAMHDCIVADQTAQTPFRAVVRAQGIDSEVAVAFLGVTEGGVWHTYQLAFDSDPGGGAGDPVTITFECTPIDEVTPCDDAELRATLCLRCTNLTPAGSCPAE